MNAIAQQENQQNQRTGDGGQRNRGFIIPPANISAGENESLVELEMPGVDRDNIEVNVENGILTVEGKIDFGKTSAPCHGPKVPIKVTTSASPAMPQLARSFSLSEAEYRAGSASDRAARIVAAGFPQTGKLRRPSLRNRR